MIYNLVSHSALFAAALLLSVLLACVLAECTLFASPSAPSERLSFRASLPVPHAPLPDGTHIHPGQVRIDEARQLAIVAGVIVGPNSVPRTQLICRVAVAPPAPSSSSSASPVLGCITAFKPPANNNTWSIHLELDTVSGRAYAAYYHWSFARPGTSVTSNSSSRSPFELHTCVVSNYYGSAESAVVTCQVHDNASEFATQFALEPPLKSSFSSSSGAAAYESAILAFAGHHSNSLAPSYVKFCRIALPSLALQQCEIFDLFQNTVLSTFRVLELRSGFPLVAVSQSHIYVASSSGRLLCRLDRASLGAASMTCLRHPYARNGVASHGQELLLVDGEFVFVGFILAFAGQFLPGVFRVELSSFARDPTAGEVATGNPVSVGNWTAFRVGGLVNDVVSFSLDATSTTKRMAIATSDEICFVDVGTHVKSLPISFYESCLHNKSIVDRNLDFYGAAIAGNVVYVSAEENPVFEQDSLRFSADTALLRFVFVPRDSESGNRRGDAAALSGGAIAGVVVGSVVGSGALVAVVVMCCVGRAASVSASSRAFHGGGNNNDNDSATAASVASEDGQSQRVGGASASPATAQDTDTFAAVDMHPREPMSSAATPSDRGGDGGTVHRVFVLTPQMMVGGVPLQSFDDESIQ